MTLTTLATTSARHTSPRARGHVQLPSIPAREEQLERLGGVLDALNDVELALQLALVDLLHELRAALCVAALVVKAAEMSAREDGQEQWAYIRKPFIVARAMTSWK